LSSCDLATRKAGWRVAKEFFAPFQGQKTPRISLQSCSSGFVNILKKKPGLKQPRSACSPVLCNQAA
jgi:hypothetical protein